MKCFWITFAVLLRSGSFGIDVINATLNIRDFDNVANKSINSFNSVPYISLYPFKDYRIIKVIDNDQVIWVDQHSNPLSQLNLICWKNEYKLLSISKMRGKGTECFEIINDTWTPISCEEYETKRMEIVDNRILDISNYYNDKKRYTTYTKFGNAIIVYKPIGYEKYIKIHDGEQIIWEANTRLLYTKSMTVHSRLKEHKLLHFVTLINYTDIPDYEYYYEKKDDGKWYSISESNYTEKSKIIENESKLDISSPIEADPFYYDFIYSHPHNLPSIIFTSKFNTLTVQVKEKDLIIWEAIEGQFCIYANVHFRNEEPVLIQLHINNEIFRGNLFFEKIDGKWHEMERASYSDKLDQYEKEKTN